MPATRQLLVALTALTLSTACQDTQQDGVVKAAAEAANKVRLLGPNDLQIVSTDRSVALEVVGDSVHVLHANSVVSVPATLVENVRYAEGRLRFDIRGLGMQIFEVQDGAQGAAFTQADALAFVGTLVQRQAEMK